MKSSEKPKSSWSACCLELLSRKPSERKYSSLNATNGQAGVVTADFSGESSEHAAGIYGFSSAQYSETTIGVTSSDAPADIEMSSASAASGSCSRAPSDSEQDVETKVATPKLATTPRRISDAVSKVITGLTTPRRLTPPLADDEKKQSVEPRDVLVNILANMFKYLHLQKLDESTYGKQKQTILVQLGKEVEQYGKFNIDHEREVQKIPFDEIRKKANLTESQLTSTNIFLYCSALFTRLGFAADRQFSITTDEATMTYVPGIGAAHVQNVLLRVSAEKLFEGFKNHIQISPAQPTKKISPSASADSKISAAAPAVSISIPSPSASDGDEELQLELDDQDFSAPSQAAASSQTSPAIADEKEHKNPVIDKGATCREEFLAMVCRSIIAVSSGNRDLINSDDEAHRHVKNLPAAYVFETAEILDGVMSIAASLKCVIGSVSEAEIMEFFQTVNALFESKRNGVTGILFDARAQTVTFNQCLYSVKDALTVASLAYKIISDAQKPSPKSSDADSKSAASINISAAWEAVDKPPVSALSSASPAAASTPKPKEPGWFARKLGRGVKKDAANTPSKQPLLQSSSSASDATPAANGKASLDQVRKLGF